MFENPFSFKGRIRRLEYGISYILFMIFLIILEVIVELSSIPEYVSLLFLIPAYWFILAQGAKRCHDRGNTGWYQIIPFYGLWMLFADGDYGENEYGPNPKGLGNTSVDDMIDDIGNPEEEEVAY